MELLGKIGLGLYVLSVSWLIVAFLRGKKKKIPTIFVVISAILTLYGFTHMPQVEEIEQTKTSKIEEIPEIKDSGEKTEISIEENVSENSNN